MAYDQYRPESHGRPKPDRRSSFKDVREDPMFWRREQPEERQSRRLPGESRHLQERSLLRSESHGEPTQPTVASYTVVSNGVDRSEILGLSRSLHRRQSTSGQAAPESSTLKASLVQHSAPSDKPVRPGDDRRVVKSTDPRSRDSGQRAAPSMDIPLSNTGAVVSSPINNGQEDMTQGGLIRDIADAVAARHATKKEYEQLVSKSRDLKQQVDSTSQMFPRANPYVEKLTEELKTVNAAMGRKKEELERANAKEQGVLNTYAMQSKVFDSMTVELQRLKDYLDEEQQNSQKLRVTNDNLQNQLAALTTRIDNLSSQTENQSGQPTTGLQERLNRIETAIFETSTSGETEATHIETNRKQISSLRSDVHNLRAEDIAQMRAQISDQKLALARMSDVFASQTSLESLTTRVDKLSTTPSADSGQPLLNRSNFVTKANLDQYVLVFNQFETAMKDRLEKLERNVAAITLEPDKYALKVDFDTSTRILAAEQAAQDQKMVKIVSDNDRWLQHSVTSEIKYKQMQESLNTVTERFQTLQKDHHQLMALPRNDAFITDLDSLKAKVVLQERTGRAHTHSINSLNQRFNNLTTEQLARQMLGVLDPMLTTLKPQVSDIVAQMGNLRSNYDQMRAQQTLMSEKSTAVDVQALELQRSFSSLKDQVASSADKLTAFETDLKAKDIDHQRVQAFQEKMDSMQMDVTKLQSIRTDLTEHFSKDSEERTELLKETINGQTTEAVDAVRKATEAAIQQAEQKQETYQSSLLLQVKEARDSIDERLIAIEDRLASKQDEMSVDDSSNSNGGHCQTIIVTPSGRQQSTVDIVDPPVPVNGTVANTTGKISKGKAGLLSKPESTKSKPVNASPLAKHFQSRSAAPNEDEEDDEDTIDITPKPKVNISKMADKMDVVYIADSDQENENVAADDDVSSPSDQETIDMSMWQKHKSPQMKRSNRPKSSPAKRSSSVVVTNDSAVQAPQTKRKRELSNTSTPRSTQDGAGSGTSTPNSARKGRKKAKV